MSWKLIALAFAAVALMGILMGQVAGMLQDLGQGLGG